MADPEAKEVRHIDELSRLPALLKEWSGVIATFGGAVAAALAVLLPGQTPAAVQVIGYVVALTLVVAGALIFVRVRHRRRLRQLRKERRERWEREAAGAHRTAFRGLFPYQEGDELPGEHRRLEARRLVTQFGEPTFSFGVVCGDSGCGKTSLLRSEVQGHLKAAGEERGFGVFYLGSPRELAEDDAQDGSAGLWRELESLRRLAEGAAQGRPLILIIDQFEEFFIKYGTPEQRLEIGRFLNELIKSSLSVRILCAIRRDYLADMKDLVPQSPDSADRNFFEPISLQTLFTLKNFTVEQATRVVGECAQRDGVNLDEEFAATLASDLGDGGFVRPPELQIVCAALGGSLTVSEYRLAGGAHGILSHYIEDAIDVSGDSAVGRRVLRALCDFPTHAKRDPQTVADIAVAVGVEGGQASAAVRTALRQFEVARLVFSERRGKGEPAYTLVHDYLVDAVLMATSDVTTRDEEANQLLDYYVSEYRTDPGTRIPYHRLRFVRRYADPNKLADSTARHLIRASITKLVTSTVTTVTLILAATTLLAALITTRRVWHQDVIGKLNDGIDSEEVQWVVQPNHEFILTAAGEGSIKLWSIKTASLVYSFKRERFIYVPPDYVLGYSASDPYITVLHVPTLRETQTTLPTQLLEGQPQLLMGQQQSGAAMSISPSGSMVVVWERNAVFLVTTEELPKPPPVRIISVADNKLMGEVSTCNTLPTRDHLVSSDGNYVLAPCFEGGQEKPTVFDVRTKEKRVLVREGYRATGTFDYNDRSSRVASLEESKDGRLYLVLWDVRRDQPIEERDVNLMNVTASVSFTPDGEFLFVTHLLYRGDEEKFLKLFRANGLRQMTTIPERGVRTTFAVNEYDNTDTSSHFILAWAGPSGGTYLWDLTEAEPRLIKDFTLPADTRYTPIVSLSPTSSRAIMFLPENGHLEFWDFKAGKKLRDLNILGRLDDAKFTIGGNAVSTSVEGGAVSLFRAEDGEKITDDIHNIGGTKRAIFYDEKCRRVHVWTDEGRVLRYTEGWHLFGRESWFWPAEKCDAR
jgi:WD40 repeat protein